MNTVSSIRPNETVLGYARRIADTAPELVVSAPDLLAALEDCEEATGDLMSFIEGEGLSVEQITSALVEIQTKARAAIAKAKGTP